VLRAGVAWLSRNKDWSGLGSTIGQIVFSAWAAGQRSPGATGAPAAHVTPEPEAVNVAAESWSHEQSYRLRE